MSIYNPIVTLGLDPELSRLVTQGYGPEVIVEVTILVPGTVGVRGGRRKREEERIIRIRVIDDDGKVMIQEQLIPENKLKDIKININENFTISGSDIYITIKDQKVKENTPTKIAVKAHETHKG